MSMFDNDEIEDLFRKELGGLEGTPDDALWSRIEKQARKKNKRKRPYTIAGWVLITSIIVVATYMLYRPPLSQEKAQSRATEPTLVTKQKATTESEQLTNRQAAIPTENNVAQSTTTLRTNPDAENQPVKHSTAIITAAPVAETGKELLPVTDEEGGRENEENKTHIPGNPTTTQANENAADSQSTQEPVAKAVADSVGKKDTKAAKKDSSLHTPYFALQLYYKQAIAGYAAPISPNKEETYKTGPGIGIRGMYRFKNRWGIGAGFEYLTAYVTTQYSEKGETHTPSDSVQLINEQLNTYYHYYYDTTHYFETIEHTRLYSQLHLPVWVSYRLKTTRRFEINANAGLAYTLLSSRSNGYTQYAVGRYPTPIDHSRTKEHYFTASLGAQFLYNASHRWGILVRPDIVLSRNNKTSLSYAVLNAGVQFKLIKKQTKSLFNIHE